MSSRQPGHPIIYTGVTIHYPNQAPMLAQALGQCQVIVVPLVKSTLPNHVNEMK